MSIKQWNSKYFTPGRGFSHVSESKGTRSVHLCGFATKTFKEGNNELENLELQTREILEKIFIVLKEANLSPSDVIRRTTFVVDLTPEKVEVILSVYEEKFAGYSKPAASLVGITALADPKMMIEIECTAMSD